MSVIVCTARREALADFLSALGRDGQEVLVAETGEAALEAAKSSSPRLVVVDEGLPDHAPLALVEKLLMANAMINTAVVSPMSEEEFHEASEGLGVLTAVSPAPGKAEAERILALLAGLPSFP